MSINGCQRGSTSPAGFFLVFFFGGTSWSAVNCKTGSIRSSDEGGGEIVLLRFLVLLCTSNRNAESGFAFLLETQSVCVSIGNADLATFFTASRVKREAVL